MTPVVRFFCPGTEVALLRDREEGAVFCAPP